MNRTRYAALILSTLALVGCAIAPKADASRADLACSQQCSANLGSCTSTFKLFPIIAQQQCNDTYDVCIKACPDRTANSAPPAVSDRLQQVEALYRSGSITKDEYESKRAEILRGL